MHTVRVIGAGLVVLGVCLLAARGMLGARGAWVARACQVFLPLWFVGAAINMWIGISRTGYTFMQELPIFFVVFLVPAFAAAVAWWRA